MRLKFFPCSWIRKHFLIGNGSDDCKQIEVVEHELAISLVGRLLFFLLSRIYRTTLNGNNTYFDCFEICIDHRL